jgi:hypothetical protein
MMSVDDVARKPKFPRRSNQILARIDAKNIGAGFCNIFCERPVTTAKV